jgi:hypothetical protein
MQVVQNIAVTENETVDIDGRVGEVDTIRERILTAFGEKLETALVENGYKLDLGDEVMRSFLPPIDFQYLPSVGYMPLLEENTALHGYHSNFDMQIQVQGVAEYGTIKPGQMAELIYADIVEAILGNTWTLGFDRGGPFKAVVGATITGATSGAIGYIAGVSLSSGAWDDEDAAGVLNLRRVDGDFINNEEIKIGSEIDVAMVDGVQAGINAVASTTGGLVDSIGILSAQPEFPNQDQKSTGVNVVFGINYKRVAGNPYSQTN